jgi:hypothetical protein
MVLTGMPGGADRDSVDIRPIRHRTQDQVRAHGFLRMLSYYITCGPGSRPSCSPTTTSPPPRPPAPRRALAKAAAIRTAADPVHSFGTLLADLATICLNTIAPADPALPGFRLVTTPPSARPLTSASATAQGSRSQQPGPDLTKAQVTGLARGSVGGTSG